MGKKLTGLAQYFDPGLELAAPGRDGVERDYTVPLASAELGLWCQQLAEITGRIHTASTEDEIKTAVAEAETLPELAGSRLTLAQRTLGSAYQQMVDDGVSHLHIQFCGATAYAWILGGEDAAERYWTSGGRPEAPGPVPNRADRRHQRGKSSPTTSTDGAPTTPSPGSGQATRSRRRSGGRGSHGRKS